jgi:hypothetical protein
MAEKPAKARSIVGATVCVQSPLSDDEWIITAGSRFRTTPAGALEVLDEEGELILSLAPTCWKSACFGAWWRKWGWG